MVTDAPVRQSGDLAEQRTQFPPHVKAQAKALCLLYGSPHRVHPMITENNPWPDSRVPSEAQLYSWTNDPRIEPDTEFTTIMAASIRIKVMHWVDKLLEPIAKATLKKAESDDPKGLLECVKAFNFISNMAKTDDVLAYGAAPGPGRDDNRSYQTIITPYGPTDPEAIDADNVKEIAAKIVDTVHDDNDE